MYMFHSPAATCSQLHRCLMQPTIDLCSVSSGTSKQPCLSQALILTLLAVQAKHDLPASAKKNARRNHNHMLDP